VTDPQESPRPTNDERIEEARRALDRNWALIVLKGKVPVQKGWQTREPYPLKTLRNWINSGHNLGLRTGAISGVIVIDDDSPDGSASAALNLPKTVSIITGSGKRHYYFAAPDIKVGNSVKSLADGIDVRGDGGQVVFVGSIHPTTGRPYTWAPGLSPDEVELAQLPDHLLDALRPKPRAPRTPRRKPRIKLLDDDAAANTKAEEPRRLEAYVRAARDAELDRVYDSSEGERNNTLNTAAFALGQLVGAGALDHNTVKTDLLNAARSIGLPEHEANATIDSGLGAGIQEPRDLQQVADPNSAASDAGPQDEASTDERPSISLIGGWLHVAVSKAERVLLRQWPPVIYQRGTMLVRVVALPEAGPGRAMRRRPLIIEATTSALVDKLTELIAWKRFDRRTEETYTVDCPERVAQTLLSRTGAWRAHPLTGVIDCPTLRGDGGILAREGYDRASGLYLSMAAGTFPVVPEQPTREHARAALDTLLDVLKGFPFRGHADRSVALAAILTALIRPALRTAPLFAFGAPKMGSGKSLLADIVSMIAAGRPAAVMAQGADENEDKKRMLPILAEGDPVAVIDNIERAFGSAALCSILTQPVWRDRVLGKSQTLSLPTTNTTWLATGNNIQFVGDITTRTLICELDPGCERPEERKFDVNLHHFIPTHRGALVVAGLTVLRAYHVAGRPDLSLTVFGRFEEWSDWVRSALVWLGEADPCETRKRIESTDPVRDQLTAVLTALQQQFGTSLFVVHDVLAQAQKSPALRDSIAPITALASPGQSAAQCLGLYFQRIDRRPESGLRLVRGNTRGGVATWRVERV
jgi:hypothetical protein